MGSDFRPYLALSGVMGDVDAEAIAQELVAKKTPLLREEIMQLAFYLRIRGSIRQRASEAALSSLVPIGTAASLV